MDTNEPVVMIGGGVAGLSAAVRLAQAGLRVVLLEAGELGSAASTRNQGWLHSGALYAREAPDYARLCHASLLATQTFCPGCIEAQVEPMAYLFADDQAAAWTSAWSAAGIPWKELPLEHVFAALPGLDRSRIQRAFQLPDRSFQADVLLAQLSATATRAGVEIRGDTPVARLLRQGGKVEGVVTSAGETISARLVVLAGGASGFDLAAGLHSAESERALGLVRLKAHLVAFRPEAGRLPFCIADRGGFNHLPHPPASIFGDGRWEQVGHPGDDAEPDRVEALRRQVAEYFPNLAESATGSLAWAGTMIQVLRFDQAEPAQALWPAVIDHSRAIPPTEDLISIFPGRATLWSEVAEMTLQRVLAKLGLAAGAARPPWQDL